MESAAATSPLSVSLSDLYLPVIKREDSYFHHIQYFRRLDPDKFKCYLLAELPDSVRESINAYYRDMDSDKAEGVKVTVRYDVVGNDVWKFLWKNGRLKITCNDSIVVQVGGA